MDSGLANRASPTRPTSNATSVLALVPSLPLNLQLSYLFRLDRRTLLGGEGAGQSRGFARRGGRSVVMKAQMGSHGPLTPLYAVIFDQGVRHLKSILSFLKSSVASRQGEAPIEEAPIEINNDTLPATKAMTRKVVASSQGEEVTARSSVCAGSNSSSDSSSRPAQSATTLSAAISCEKPLFRAALAGKACQQFCGGSHTGSPD